MGTEYYSEEEFNLILNDTISKFRKLLYKVDPKTDTHTHTFLILKDSGISMNLRITIIKKRKHNGCRAQTPISGRKSNIPIGGQGTVSMKGKLRITCCWNTLISRKFAPSMTMILKMAKNTIFIFGDT